MKVWARVDIDSHLIIPLSGDCNDFPTDIPSHTDDSRYFTDGSSNPFTKLDFNSEEEESNAFVIDSSPFSTLDLDDLGQTASGPNHRETVVIKLKGKW